MANRWEKRMETVTDFIFLGAKVTADGDCSHELKRHLLAPWKKSYDKPREHIKKQRHHFADKGLSSQSHGFSSSHIQMWELDHKEGWAPKNWCFQIVVLEKTLLRVPWTARRSNQSTVKEISPKYSLEGLMLKWKLQYFLMRRTDSLEKTLMLGNTEGKREGDNWGWDSWMASPTQWTWVWEQFGRRWRTRKPGVL